MLISRQWGSFDLPGDWQLKSETPAESSFRYFERESLLELFGIFGLYTGDSYVEARRQHMLLSQNLGS